MEFLEGSRGIYRPIRVLFETPIYDRALQLCWNMNSYKSQIALVRELLSLQQKKQIPSQVTAEDMIDLILERSKHTLRERLWEFELEDFDEEDAKPLLMLVWAVNVCNKMRDVEFEARMLLNSPEDLPPSFQNPKVLSCAKDYAKILRKKQMEAPSSKLLCPREVVIKVVPRVLQGFWVLPPHLLLNMPSQKLSNMSVGVTKAVLDRVSSALPGEEHQATLSRSARDNMVLSILINIRQAQPHDVLVNRLKTFAPVLLSDIVDVAVGQICGFFQPQSPKVPAHLTPTDEPPATAPVKDDLNQAVAEDPPTPSPVANSAVVLPPSASLTPPAGPPSIADVEAREDECDKACLESDTEPTREPDSDAVTTFLTPPAGPPSVADVEAREDDNDKFYLEKDSKATTEPASAATPAPLAPVTPPAEPVFVTAVQEREQTTSSPETISAEVSPPPAPGTSPTEPICFNDVQEREDGNEKQSLEEGLKFAREPDPAVVPVSSAPVTTPLDPVIIVTVSEVEMTKEEGVQGFFCWLFQPLCCCFK